MLRSCILQCRKLAKITPIEDYIVKVINNVGPISVHHFMRDVLTESSEGYYMKRDVFGKSGDFITSPDISQMFGELWAVWIVTEWTRQGSPHSLQLVELGPGRGTLMQDILRSLARFPDTLAALESVSLVELSPTLRQLQETNIGNTLNRIGLDVNLDWWDRVEDVPSKGRCSVFLAHEFLDALPIHKFHKKESGKWTEVMVGLDNSADSTKLQFSLADKETPALLAFNSIISRFSHLNHLEISPEAVSVVLEIGRKISEDGGFALLADYGHLGDKEDTFRAFKKHKVTDPLKNVGEADLTADVNFKLLNDQLTEKMSKSVMSFGPVSQREFLCNMGIDVRLKMLLASSKTSEARDHLLSGYSLMMDSSQMGDRFKFFALVPRKPCYSENYLPAGYFSLQ